MSGPENGLISTDHYLTLLKGEFAGTTPEDLAHLFQTLGSEPNRGKPLVIHFHGGLVSEASGMATANRLLPVYVEAGAYPVFFVWKSSIPEVVAASFVELVQKNLEEISREKIFEILRERVTAFAVAKVKQAIGLRGGLLDPPSEAEVKAELEKLNLRQEPYPAVRPRQIPEGEVLSETEKRQFEGDLQRNPELKAEAQKIANGLKTPQEVAADSVATRGAAVRGSTQTLMSPDVVEDARREASDPATRGVGTAWWVVQRGVNALARVVKRFGNRRDHGLYTTIVEEILREFYLANVGGTIWTEMKNQTADAFGADPKIYGGTAFLQGLKALAEEGRSRRIILIGHSTGAVYICQFLKHAADILPEQKFDVVFLAPACTFLLMSETLGRFRDAVANLRVFTMSDKYESQDVLVPVIYTRSLLYFVSGVVEDDVDMPLVGMERFYSGNNPYLGDPIQGPYGYLKQLENGLIWSVTAAGALDGLSSDAISHGAFASNPATLKSLQRVIREGF